MQEERDEVSPHQMSVGARLRPCGVHCYLLIFGRKHITHVSNARQKRAARQIAENVTSFASKAYPRQSPTVPLNLARRAGWLNALYR